jgi:PAS domain S-box-containing protein
MAGNVTDRLQVEQSTNLLAAIVDCSDDAIISKNLDGIVISWNKSAERIFGYSADEAIGQHISLIIPPERHAEESTILDRLRRGDRVDHFHTVRRRKDGRLIDVSLTISPVRDSAGRIVGASKVARDITAEKGAERALRESEQRFRVVTDASPVLVWMSGTDKLCYYFNKGWLDFVGRTLEQESGNGWAENVHPEDFDRCLQIYLSNFDARRSFEMEYRMRHHTGQYRWILDRGVPRHAPDGTFEGYIGACLDIHDQKEAAEKGRIADDMTRLMKAQDEERRHIARELHDSAGQTLAVLSMNLSRLVRRVESLAPDLARDGKEIETTVLQLHREIRTASYLLHPPLLDESGLASALSCYVEGLAERTNVAIALDIADNVAQLPSDMELAIFRFVQECLTNIHRHSASKTALIRIARQGESIRAEVQDHGKGISPERLMEIQSRGSGVGLRGIRERIRPFDGEMKIESNDAGTSVIVRLRIPMEGSFGKIASRCGPEYS